MTKLKVFFMLSVLLGGSLLNTQPSAAQTKVSPALFCSLGTDKDKVRHKSGPEVANRVKEIRKTNKRVNDALAAFERIEKTSKRKPDIDAATSMTFDIEKKSEAVAGLFRKASFHSGQHGSRWVR